jgi:hypothetical protein
MLPPTEPQVFKNGCPLACVAWQLKRHGYPFTQESLFNDHKDKFPLWQEDHGRGALTRSGVVTLIEALPISSRNYIHTQYHQDCLEIYRRHPGLWIFGFVFFRRPTNHSLAILGFQDDFLVLMDPSPPGRYLKLSYTDLFNNHDADYLLFFADESANQSIETTL